jgi:hypothetical protein
MKTRYTVLAVLALLSAASVGYGMATERIGPDKAHRHPTVEQPEWPAHMVKLLGHDSRVYSVWVNGNENFYFNASAEEIDELLKLYSNVRLRDHVLLVKAGKPKVRTFKGQQIKYNVNLHYLGGIALAMTRLKGTADTLEPTMTIYIDPDTDSPDRPMIPQSVIVQSEAEGWKVDSTAKKPSRKLWHAKVAFDNDQPAADFENGVSTYVTLWEEGKEAGFRLGTVDREGQFRSAFSDKEIAFLEAGKMRLTLTVGNYMTEQRRGDPQLPIECLSTDLSKAQLVTVAGPKFYYGRLLFDDGKPAILDPPPWPGAEISVTFPFAGQITIDQEGYFRVFFTPDQFERLKQREARKNVYIPNFERRGRSTARVVFPASKLSLDKSEAGVVRIPRPDN